MPKAQVTVNVPPVQKMFLELLPEALLNAFNTNDRINHYLIDNLSRQAWIGNPQPGKDAQVQPLLPTFTMCVLRG